MKIITNVSHVDHGLNPDQINYLLERFSDQNSFFLETVEFPFKLGGVPCGLYGPIMGDEPIKEEDVVYRIRGTRKCASRIVVRRGQEGALPPLPRLTNKVTIIAGPVTHNTERYPCVLYTVYGGPAAPREPGDVTIPTWEGIVESRKFWAEHALCE